MAIDSSVLINELKAQIADIDGVDGSGNVSVVNNRQLTSEEQTTVAGIIATHEANYDAMVAQREQAVLDAKASRDDVIGTQADNAIAQIDADIATLDGSPTNAQLIAMLRRALVRDRKTILYLKRNA